jgi:hypothetical protein
VNTEFLREMARRAQAIGHPQFAQQLQRQLDRIDNDELQAYRRLVGLADWSARANFGYARL